MRRLFPFLALVAGLLLMAGYYSGLVGRRGDQGRVARLAGAAAALTVHASAFVYLLATARRVEESARRGRMPEWVGAQAEKNWRKALIYQFPGLAITVAGAGLVFGEWWDPIVWGSSVSFQVGMFLAESMIITAQSRLLGDVKAWSDSSRPAGFP